MKHFSIIENRENFQITVINTSNLHSNENHQLINETSIIWMPDTRKFLCSAILNPEEAQYLIDLFEGTVEIADNSVCYRSENTAEILNFLKQLDECDPLPLQYMELIQELMPNLKINTTKEYLQKAFHQFISNGQDQSALELALLSGNPDSIKLLALCYKFNRQNDFFRFYELLADNKHQEVIELAANASNPDIIQLLIQAYQIQQNFALYIDTLENVPAHHPDFVELNLALYHELLTEDAQNLPNLSERKLQALFNSKQGSHASRVFDTLCGISNVQPRFETIAPNARSFIQIAQHEKKLLEELNELREFKQQVTSSNRAITVGVNRASIFAQDISSNEEKEQFEPEEHKHSL